MELALNLGWMVLATSMCGLWMYYAPTQGPSRRTQLISLVLVIAILFPVISVTDDIMMAQNPAVTDCCRRRDHARTDAHPATHPVAAMLPPFSAQFCCDSSQFLALRSLLDPTVNLSAIGLIQNRPPPSVRSISSSEVVS
jgi:hypothetical protein